MTRLAGLTMIAIAVTWLGMVYTPEIVLGVLLINIGASLIWGPSGTTTKTE